MGYKDINVALESFSFLICFVLLAYQIINKQKEKTDKWFSLLIISNMMMLSGDIVDCGFGGIPGMLNRIMQIFFTLLVYYIGSGLLVYSLFGWIASSVEQRTKMPKIWMKISTALCAIQVLIALTMPFTKICYVDELNKYQRGSVELFMFAHIAPYSIFLLCLILLVRYFKVFEKGDRYFVLGFLLLPLSADMVQIINGNYLIMNVAITLGLVGFITFIQLQRQLEKDRKIQALIKKENEKLGNMGERQENLIFQLIDVLCKTVEAKDIYTRGHSLRVAQYAREIMYRLGGDEQAQQDVYCIGILHDVGKISVKDEIINKKGRLTEEEYEQIKLHTVAGYQILRGVDLIPDLAIGARWHHERYDGTGYPNGLAGENIPLIARIISVADAYEAMTSNRSYHTVMPQNEVRNQIEKGMGTQFDPKIAQIMLDMIDEDMQYEMKQEKYSRVTNILMIDDDTISHMFVERVFNNENYVLTFASSGEEGIELLKENRYDLCLLDMEMPSMNGFEVLEWIHNNIRRMKVIFLTGDKEMKTIKKSEELGAVDYITKPINVKILRESVNSVLTH